MPIDINDPLARRRYLRMTRQERITADLQEHLDATARSMGYDSMLSAVSYVTSTNPKFMAEAVSLRDWRDAFWIAAYAYEQSVVSGARPEPTSYMNVLPFLPAYQRPAT